MIYRVHRKSRILVSQSRLDDNRREARLDRFRARNTTSMKYRAFWRKTRHVEHEAIHGSELGIHASNRTPSVRNGAFKFANSTSSTFIDRWILREIIFSNEAHVTVFTRTFDIRYRSTDTRTFIYKGIVNCSLAHSFIRHRCRVWTLVDAL